MMLHKTALALGFLLVTTGVSAAAPDAWQRWHEALLRQCPQSHVEWSGGQGYDELIGAYSKSLPRNQSRRLDRAANYQASCANVSAGFECEMRAYLAAAQRLDMLNDMAAFSCREVHCEEPGSCSRFPHSR